MLDIFIAQIVTAAANLSPCLSLSLSLYLILVCSNLIWVDIHLFVPDISPSYRFRREEGTL